MHNCCFCVPQRNDSLTFAHDQSFDRLGLASSIVQSNFTRSILPYPFFCLAIQLMPAGAANEIIQPPLVIHRSLLHTMHASAKTRLRKAWRIPACPPRSEETSTFMRGRKVAASCLSCITNIQIWLRVIVKSITNVQFSRPNSTLATTSPLDTHPRKCSWSCVFFSCHAEITYSHGPFLVLNITTQRYMATTSADALLTPPASR
ncbi:hypothetical protein V8B97DRAFT_1316037 [Scleroderma yunnanense]